MQSLNLTRDEAEWLVELIESQPGYRYLADDLRRMFGMSSREQEEHILRIYAAKAWRRDPVSER